jgi:hypothetical protein
VKMSTENLLEYVYEQVIERLVERVPGTSEESERVWFNQMVEDWICSQQSPDVEGLSEDLCDDDPHTVEFECRTSEGEPMHQMTIGFEGVEPERLEDAANVPTYDPPPIRRQQEPDMVQLWMRAAYEPWPDLPLERAAQVLSRHIVYSVPRPPLTHESVQLGWDHFSPMEARALAFELHVAGVDIEALLTQIEAFPYGDISLAWLTEPDRCIHLHTSLVEQMEEEERDARPESLARLRHNAEFIYRMAMLISSHVRIWLRGWSAAYTHAAFARAVGLAPDE